MSTTENHFVTGGCTLKILKGMRDAYGTAGKVDFKAGEEWFVTRIRRPETGLIVCLERNGNVVSMCTSAAGKTAHPEFNLHTGDPTRMIRVTIIKRPT